MGDGMANGLAFEKTASGLIVRMGEPPIPVGEWTVREDGPPGLGVLIRLRDDGDAFERSGGLFAPWHSVAGLTSDELRITGLPDVAPFSLEVVADGALHTKDFQIHYGFVRDGRRVVGAERSGAWLHVAGDDFVLLDPLYTLAEAITQFCHGAADIESRMLRWAQIADQLPADAIVDDRLRSLRIAVASSFRLEPFVNSVGEPDFDPVVGRRETRTATLGEDEQVFAGILPAARQSKFARQFRRLPRVKHRYAVGDGTYVVLTPNVEHALGAVRRAQAGTADKRRDFLKHVHGYLRLALDSVGTGEIPAIDDVFDDDSLSERVAGVGNWVTKVVPWIRMTNEPWMPPEAFGLRIGELRVALTEDELPSVLEQVRSAVAQGKWTVRIADVDLPATPETVEAVEALVRRAQPVEQPAGGAQTSGEPELPGPVDQVLLVIDNLETVEFHRERQHRVSGIASVHPKLETKLLPHQKDGVKWLAEHWEAGSCGALLADDMGLGKTLEALAFLNCVQRHERASGAPGRPMLIVAPTGLLQNWKDEHERHLVGSGLGHVVEAHGSLLRHLRDPNVRSGTGGEPALAHRLCDLPGEEIPDGAHPGRDAARRLSVLDIKKLENADWVLTTYETLRDYQFSFGRIEWSVGVFDEAQKIKNPSARLTDAALAMNVGFAVLMTGTPVENRPADIWSLLDRVAPGRFGPLKEFSRTYECDANHEQSLAALHRKLTQPDASTSRSEGGIEPKRPAPALMLRRLKADHIDDLPDKCVFRRVGIMPPQQAEAYASVVEREHCGNMLQVLHRLRSLSLHPFVPDDADIDGYIQASARLSETFKILERVAASGEKALIFVEAREIQGFLISALRRRFDLAEDVLVINGAVSGRIRKARVDTFQSRSGFDAMILSPRAGGVGLTLTAANHVIHLSRWWNPAVEDQCTDRAFRIGQRRRVHIYLPIARHPDFGDYSFDVKLDSLMERKRDMNRRVLAPTGATSADVHDLYRSTVQEARAGAADDETDDSTNVDLLEPVAFEDWVLRQLQAAGYETRRTPHSRDRGADGLAIADAATVRHTLIVQCKHTQRDAMCGRAAVEEVLRSIPAYQGAIRGDPRPMVVTNAAGFTRNAEQLAHQEGVRLVHRGRLADLRRFPLGGSK